MNAPASSGADAIEHTRRALLLSAVVILVAAAWLAIWLWGASPSGVLLHRHGHAPFSAVSPQTFGLVIAGWMVMTLAMMLPTSLPVLALFHTIAGRRADRGLLVALVIAGYVCVWAGFGILVYAGQLLLSVVPDVANTVREHSAISGASILWLAGVYQFTPLKYRCLEKCRSPFSFVIEHWQGERDRLHALRLGLEHGLFCLGCCWALMLLMFVTGFGNLAWMFLLAAVMAVEKNVSWGRRLSAPLGLTLILSGVLIAF